MDTDGDGCVEKLEFLQKMLVRLGKCETVDIDEIIGQFEQLDEDGSVRKTAKRRPFILLHFVALKDDIICQGRLGTHDV